MEPGIIIERLGNPSAIAGEEPVNVEKGLRPQRFADYPGQTLVKENLRIYVSAARARKKPLDHVVLHGPPGLGKTTLAIIIAKELEVPFYHMSGPSVEKPGDLAGLLAGIEQNALLFVDEIHRLNIQVEEVLYSAMEDFCIDIVIGQGPTARSVRMPLKPFTLVGATTKLSSLSRPFLSRFGIQERLDYYDDEALREILMRSAEVLGIPLQQKGAFEMARRSRGTPRIANRLLRRVWDFAHVAGKTVIDEDIVNYALSRLDIDPHGLDRTDRDILRTIAEKYQGGPVGIDTLAATIGEEKATIEEVYEPYLVHKGFVKRGPRGRSLTPLAQALGITEATC
ncbi:MAG: Holliday junction branch migration DNA helicase RuvB [Deltaproteobacteria bacterium]|nr:Holliday junction branch migration DNA helicase RuvB [Deltaproteobacteria bacterium]